ncbi:MAG TPA: FHA domain-containing protein [Verrucomicrobiae bacterium]|nr:FHA domain-containing protein [Verrucomicrobiae bacterium]
MARLLIKTEGFGERALVLRLGVNHVGRDEECEHCIDHPTISSRHCELALTADGVYVRDCHSTNGTFINDKPVMEAWLDPGQKLRFGDVELLVESIDANMAIPKFERPTQIAPPPAVLPDGLLSCPRHVEVRATYQCPHCKEVMCNACVHVMRRKGGNPHFLCVICSHECEPFQIVHPKKKKGLFGFLGETVKLKFQNTIRHLNGED